jgi:hypothetical protein
MKLSSGKILLFLIYAVSFGGTLLLALDGLDYYRTPLVERARHELFWSLKPGGTTGHTLGIVGSALMVLMLVYTVRKRWRRLRRVGRLSGWLHFHIYCGVIGPLLVILHSSFKVQGLVALSFWSMILVALSGFVGRYLYVQIPRRRQGDELTLSEAEALNRDTARRLTEDLGVPAEALTRLDRLAAVDPSRGGGALALFLHLPLSGLRLRSALRRLQRDLPPLPRDTVGDLRSLLLQRAQLQRRIALWDRLQALFHYWHVLHKPFAVVMYLFMLVHIAVALATGYGW